MRKLSTGEPCAGELHARFGGRGELRKKLFSSNYSVPLFEKEGLGEILLDKSPSIPLFQRGR